MKGDHVYMHYNVVKTTLVLQELYRTRSNCRSWIRAIDQVAY